ncbi:MAG: methyltransferase domain-containing protein [Oleispira sp.]|nr:methyltransferase domain-containing protein [Oleispira sp.]MBL4881701.1 methyltransferase domain-containing protein [Oleispira sp.]
MNLLHASNTNKTDRLDLDSYTLLVQEANRDFAKLQSNEQSEDTKQSVDSDLLASSLYKVKQALELNPIGMKGLNLFARIELFRGNPHKAQIIIERALIAKPDSPTALYSAGHIALALGQLASAEQHFSASLKISKVATRSASSLAYTYLEQGKFVEAFQLYQELVKTQADDPHIRNKLLESASHINADFYSQELESNVLRYLEFEDVDYSLLRNLITTLLHHKFQINEASTPLEFDQIAADPLLLGSLKRFHFCDALLERLFISLRQTLLFNTVQDMTIPSAHLELAHDMAVQAQLNEYVWPVTKDEKNIIDGLEKLLFKITEESQWQLDDIAPAILILAQYKDLSKSILATALVAKPIKQALKNSYLADIIDYAINNRESEIQLAKNLPYWTHNHSANNNPGTKNSVSAKVQDQYEENPYPRWKDIGFNIASSYQQALLKNFPQLNLSHWRGKAKLNVLVAGCGTGRQAIRLASYFNDLNVVAIDLSGRSLAYAKQQAKKYKVKNVQFIQADILEFSNFPMLFDVIECSGVLHHMEDPEQGLQSLQTLLSPTGVMKIALYSEAARKQVITFRKLIADNSQQTGQALDQRLLRQALLMKQIPGHWDKIVNSQDFYSMSNCRDLIFHEQEHQFTPAKIADLLANNHLDFIGMLPTTSARQTFEQQIGDLASNNTLENWDKVEQSQQDIFEGMYQFYCRKQSNIKFL